MRKSAKMKQSCLERKSFAHQKKNDDIEGTPTSFSELQRCVVAQLHRLQLFSETYCKKLKKSLHKRTLPCKCRTTKNCEFPLLQRNLRHKDQKRWNMSQSKCLSYPTFSIIVAWRPFSCALMSQSSSTRYVVAPFVLPSIRTAKRLTKITIVAVFSKTEGTAESIHFVILFTLDIVKRKWRCS